MLRLLNGDNVDLLMLARNAGTSVDQLERFYLSHADPAMKVENLHSSRLCSKVPDEELQKSEPRPTTAETSQVGRVKILATLSEP
jgi:hypothetical protein